jgi:hypothetical protein
MRIRDGIARQWLSTDEAYDRFFDGYYNLGRPGEILGRDIVVSRQKAEVPKEAVRIARPQRSTKRLAGIK